MAITEVVANGVINVTPDGSADWNSLDQFPNGMRIHSIQFQGSADGDIMVLRDGDGGPVMFRAEIGDTDNDKVKYLPGRKFKPFMDDTDCTFDTAASCMLIIVLRSM